MMSKLSFVALMAMLAVVAKADDMMAMDKVEDSTVSPIADMAIIDAEMKTSTERPPVMEAPKQEEKPASQRHTVADFIIHPLIAFKPRNPEDDGTAAVAAAGKQANNGASSTTTPSPWQLFGFNAGQGLGSQVTNLAGQVSGWLNDRIQFPGLVETPVRESSTTSTSTTTTPRPDVVVRVQHKASTRRPLIAIDNRNRPNRPQFESEENNDDDDEDEDEEDNGEENNSDEAPEDNESSNEVQENNESEEEDDDQNKNENENGDDENEEEDHSQRPNNRRRPLRNNNNKNRNGQRRRVQPQQQQQNRRRLPNNRRQPQRRRPAAAAAATNEVSDEEEVQDDDEYDNGNDEFYYGARPSTKRSQSSQNFIQRGQQQLINQIRQLTRGQTPAEIGNAIRKAQRGNGANNNNRRRPQQATLFYNRNGQTYYVAPEIAPMAVPQYQQIYAQPIVQKPMMANAYPQPPLTVPLKRKGQPTQYITIPWSQLGISPPNNIVSITEGVQAQPLILNIPQSAINTMQHQAAGGRPKKKRPQLITADAVPLLAEASLMEIFKPPQIPPSRTSSTSSKPATVSNAMPVIVASKPSSTKTSSALFTQHIRPGTIIEKAPEMDDMKQQETTAESESSQTAEEGSKIDMLRATGEKEFILVGDDNEPGLQRHVEPAYGDARYIRLTGNSQFYDVLPRRRFTVRRGGRQLTQTKEMPEESVVDKTEQLIPVQIVNEPEVPSAMGESSKPPMSESTPSEMPAMDTVLSDPRPAGMPAMDTVLSDPRPAVLVPETTQQSTDAMMSAMAT